MKTLVLFLLGLACGVGLAWWYLEPGRAEARRARTRFEEKAGRVAEKARDTAVEWKDKLAGRIDAWELDPASVKEDLEKTGRVVRHKARRVGAKVADVAADARVTAEVKGKLALDKELSSWGISVATSDGRVTLSGTVASAEEVGRATAIALEVPGVTEVSADLKVKGPEKP